MLATDAGLALRLVRGLTAAGRRRGWRWVEYHPKVMLQIHRFATRDAEAIVSGIRTVSADADLLVDVGAGTGAIAAAWKRRGHRAIACERSAVGRLAARLQGVPCVPFELANDPPSNLPNQADIALCLEVAEHVPASLAEQLVAFLANLAPIAIFSAAIPGQGGQEHVNEQPPEYWTRRFQAVGFAEDLERSSQLRAAFERFGVQAPWYVKNTRVFRQDR